MYSDELSRFLAIHASAGVGNVAATLKALASSDELGIPPSVVEALLISSEYLAIISRNAHELVREDTGARRSGLNSVLRAMSADLAAPR